MPGRFPEGKSPFLWGIAFKKPGGQTPLPHNTCTRNAALRPRRSSPAAGEGSPRGGLVRTRRGPARLPPRRARGARGRGLGAPAACPRSGARGGTVPAAPSLLLILLLLARKQRVTAAPESRRWWEGIRKEQMQRPRFGSHWALRLVRFSRKINK